MAPDAPSLALGLLLIAVAGGAVVQGVLGFGFSLVAVPIIALIRPQALPAVVILLLIPSTGWVAYRERFAIDPRGMVWLTIGRLPGTVGGLLLLTIVSAHSLETLFGVLLLVAVGMSFSRPIERPTVRLQLAAGFAAGLMGTAAAVGGPPQALIYKDRPGPELRSTISLASLIGLAMSFASLAFVGRVGRSNLMLGAEVLPSMVVGLWLSRLVLPVIDRGRFRLALYVFASVSGALAVAKGLGAY